MQCKICAFRCCTHRKYELHQYLHRNWTGVVFFCVHHGCNMIFKTYIGFKQHIYRQHSLNENKVANKMQQVICCPLNTCDYFTKNVKEIFMHGYNHIKNGLTMYCPLKDICN